MKPVKILCFWAAYFLLYVPLYAQTLQPYTVNYTVENGVPSSECYSVAQDKKGIIWVGTDKGLCKYDGVRFSRFTIADGLPDNVIFGVYVDDKDRVWCRTLSRGVFYISNGKINVPAFNNALLQFTGNNFINNFCVTAHDSVFMEVNNYSFVCAAVNGKSIVAEKPEVKRIRFVGKTGFVYGKVSSHLYISDGSGFARVRNSISFTDVIFRSVRLMNNDILFNHVDYLYLRRYHSDSMEIVTRFKSRIISIYQDRDSGVWIGTINNGVYYYPKSLTEKPSHYFGHESVSDIMQDAEGNIWISSLKSGLYFIVNKNVLSIGSSKQPFNIINKTGNGYIACSKNGDIFFLNNLHVIKTIKSPTGGHSYTQIHEYDSNSWLFIGLGAFLLDKRTYRNKNYFLKKNYYRGVCDSKNGKYLYMYSHNIIHRRNKRNKQLVDSIFCPVSRIFDMETDHADNIWLATLSGLVMYNNARKEFLPQGTGPLASRINALKLLPGKMILATDNDGVLIYNPTQKTYRQISEKEGISSNNCQGIWVDKEEIWIATNKGISVIYCGQNFEQVKAVRKIDMHDGLPGPEINMVIVNGDYVWAASNSGLIRFKKNLNAENRLPPSIYMERVITNKSTYTGHEKKPTLASDENYLEFHFYGISYKSLKNLKYKYRLKGAGDNWNYTYHPGITYPALTPGKYEFELYSVNNDGVASVYPVVFAFEIRPPFWLTWPFLSAVLLTVSGIIFLVFYIRIQSIRKREKERNSYHTRILEFELRALKAQMNPHFIFNAVASIQNYILTSDPKSANKYLVKFSKLIRGVLDNSHSSLITLTKELTTLKLYIDIENLRFLNQIDYNIVIEEGVDADRFMIPPMLIQPFVENAIWHGLLPKKENCRLSIVIGIKGNTLECRINDNGIGRQAAALGKTNTHKQSLGLEMTRSRIVALEKIYNMKLSIEIIDKINVLKQPAGTEVIITLPVIT